MTNSEIKLWQILRNRGMCGYKFRRQHPVDIFIVDFYCHKLKLAIEVDGNIHLKKRDYDEGRTAGLNNIGIQVIRFTNEQIENDIADVLKQIKYQISDIINQIS